jgi:hypothetical protein
MPSNQPTLIKVDLVHIVEDVEIVTVDVDLDQVAWLPNGPVLHRVSHYERSNSVWHCLCGWDTQRIDLPDFVYVEGHQPIGSHECMHCAAAWRRGQQRARRMTP